MARLFSFCWKNLANFVTFTGLCSGFYLLFMVCFNPENLKGIACSYVYGFITDFIDGPIARRLKIESAFGSFLDRVRDRALVFPALFLLILRNLEKFGWLVVSAIIAYLVIEALVSLAGLAGLLYYSGVDLAPCKMGKRKTFAAFIVGLVIILTLNAEKYLSASLFRYSFPLILAGLVLMGFWGILSLLEYCQRKPARGI